MFSLGMKTEWNFSFDVEHYVLLMKIFAVDLKAI